MELAAVLAAVRAALALGRFLRAWWARVSSRCTSTSSSLSSRRFTCRQQRRFQELNSDITSTRAFHSRRSVQLLAQRLELQTAESFSRRWTSSLDALAAFNVLMQAASRSEDFKADL